MNEVTINIYPAKSGDAFLVRFSNKKNIVIDMGFGDTYRDYIRADLEEIKRNGEKINLLVITHIDKDHIEGVIEFIKENSFSKKSKIIDIDDIWHNSYRHLQIRKNGKLVDGNPEVEIIQEIKDSNDITKCISSNESKQISAYQGSTLASYLFGYEYNWNTAFKNMAVSTENCYENNMDDVYIKLLSPNNKKLMNLSRKWLAFLKNKKFDFKITEDKVFDDAYELYIRNLRDFEINEEKQVSYQKKMIDIESLKNIKTNNTDRSESNGASIALEIVYNGVRMLFLGDCHEDILINNFKKNIGNKNYYDLIKIPHHGSLRNNSEWINYVRAKYYIFSTDSITHKEHPSKEVISKIIFMNKGSKEKIYLVFNYKINIIVEFDKKELKDKYNYDFIYKENDEKICLIL